MTLQSVENPDPEVRLSRKVQNDASQCSARTLLQDLTLTAVTCTVAGPSTVSQRNHQENKKQSILCMTVPPTKPMNMHNQVPLNFTPVILEEQLKITILQCDFKFTASP